MDPPLAAALTAALGGEVHDADEETFLLYAQPAASRDLGFVDPRAASVCVSLAGRDVTVRQSPAVLASSRPGGTTGAVTPQLASWLAAPNNPLLALVLPSSASSSSVLELGCGISPLNALALGARVAHYVLSDQAYVQKLLVQNLADALDDVSTPKAAAAPRRRARPRKTPAASASSADVCFRPLDWETDAATPALAAPRDSFDAVLSCDCVYNEALVAPFVQTCVDVCRLRRGRRRRARGAGVAGADADADADGDDNGTAAPCVCIVAQQLRSDDVFRAWLVAFHGAFRVWRVPPDMLPPELRPCAGFTIHVGILRVPDDE